MSAELIYSDATKLADLIRKREISPVEVMKAHLDRIEAINPKVNAIVTIVDSALKSAKNAEEAVLRGDELAPLHGEGFDRHRKGTDPTWIADLQRTHTRNRCEQCRSHEALKGFGHTVEPVRIPALERDFGLDVFSRLHILDMKPGFVKAAAGRNEDEISYMARFMLGLPDTPAADYIDAVQGAEHLKDGYAEYFQKYDILLTPVLPTPSFKHGQEELLINGQTTGAMDIMNISSHLNVTGLLSVSMQFGTSKGNADRSTNRWWLASRIHNSSHRFASRAG